MPLLGSDVRLGVRALRRRPLFTLLAIVTLTIGVGANAAVFRLVDAIFLQPLPFVRDPDRLVDISRRIGGDFGDVSYGVFQAMRAERGILADAAAYTTVPVSLAIGDGTPMVRMVVSATGNYFDVLGVRPAFGRLFASSESFYPAVATTVVISDRLWRERFASDPSVLGRALRMNGVSLTIVGVTPPGFRGHAAGLAVDAYVPVGVPIPGFPTPASLDDARSGALQILARLRPGISRAVAAQALGVVSTRFLMATPARVTGAARESHVVRVDAFSPVPVVIREGVAAFLAVLLAASALLLTMTCVNVASMILSRATERRTEIAVRYALGASRRRIVAQLLTESAILFVIAGVTGALLAAWVTPLLMMFRPPLPPGFAVDLDLRANWRVFGYASIMATVCGIVFSIMPALRATRTDLAPILREHADDGAPSRNRLRGALVGIQMAATIVLLIVAGLFTRALGALDALDPGWNANGVYVTTLDLELNGTGATTGRALLGQLTQRLSAVPGVKVAALAAKLPFSGQSSLGPVVAQGREAPEPTSDVPAYFNRVSTGYFEAMGIPLLRGRDVVDADGPSRPNVAVINAAMAARLWPGVDAVGRRFNAGVAPNQTTFEVVGVVANSKVKRLNEVPPNVYYLPYRQRYNSAMALVVRFDADAPAGTTDAIRKAIGELAPGLPVEPLQPLRAALEVYFLPQRIAAWVGGVLGVLGMLIAAVGAYGVAAIAVAQRRREIGIRLALGAGPRDLVTLLLRRVMRAPTLGIVTGLMFALGLTWPLRPFLGVVHPLDPTTFAAASLALAAVIVFAAWAPTTRAARLNPIEVLRKG